MGDHALLDVDSDVLLPWRLEGQQWEPQEGEGTSATADDAADDAAYDGLVISLQGGKGVSEAVDQLMSLILAPFMKMAQEKMASLPQNVSAAPTS